MTGWWTIRLTFRKHHVKLIIAISDGHRHFPLSSLITFSLSITVPASQSRRVICMLESMSMWLCQCLCRCWYICVGRCCWLKRIQAENVKSIGKYVKFIRFVRAKRKHKTANCTVFLFDFAFKSLNRFTTPLNVLVLWSKRPWPHPYLYFIQRWMTIWS